MNVGGGHAAVRSVGLRDVLSSHTGPRKTAPELLRIAMFHVSSAPLVLYPQQCHIDCHMSGQDSE